MCALFIGDAVPLGLAARAAGRGRMAEPFGGGAICRVRRFRLPAIRRPRQNLVHGERALGAGRAGPRLGRLRPRRQPVWSHGLSCRTPLATVARARLAHLRPELQKYARRYTPNLFYLAA